MADRGTVSVVPVVLYTIESWTPLMPCEPGAEIPTVGIIFPT